MRLSIVTTAYLSAATLETFCSRALAAGQSITDDLELIIVNDGSPDDSRDRACAIHRQDPRVVVVDLVRNFGHHRAMMTGLAQARGDLVFLIDCDLEEAPEDLQSFFQRMQDDGCDVVYGVQEKRRGGWFERSTGYLFFSIMEWLSDDPVPRNLVTARLMTREYVRALIRHRDRASPISHLWTITGFRQQALVVNKLSLSPTSYSFSSRMTIAINHIATTSTKLLSVVLYIGLSIFVLSVFVIGYYLMRYFVFSIGIDGYTSLIISIWFLGGLTILVLGILGIYLATIMAETKRRPYTIVRKIHRFAEGRLEMAGEPPVRPDLRDAK